MKYTIFAVLATLCLHIIDANAQRGMQQLIEDPETGRFIQPYENSWAIIIGIDRYQYVDPLDYAVADARAIKNLLVEDFGFADRNITLLTDRQATRENITRAFGDLYNVGVEDRVLIFFAGHGETIDLATGGNMGFLIPFEGRAGSASDLYATSLSMQTLRELSSYIPAKHVLFLIDACYGGLAASGARSLSRETQGYVNKITRARARQILTAGGRGEQVVERPEWGHSAFTYILLDGLGRGLADLDNDGVITASELAGYLRSMVPRITNNRQTPQFRAFTHDEGEFLFILPRLPDTVLPPAPAARFGDIFISSDPAGAEILINGERIQQTTPAEIRRIAEGEHTIELRSGNLYASTTINIEPDRINRISLNLETARGSLRVSSTPFEAQVYINGEYKGTTPVLLTDLYAGRYDLTLQKSGYLPFSERVDVKAFDQETVEAKLVLPASMNVTSTPAGAAVYLDGELKGESPLVIADLYPGEYSLRVIKEEYEEWRENVYAREGEAESLRANLLSKFGYISIKTTPQDADIFIDGNFVAKGDLRSYRVPVGRREIEVVHSSARSPARQTVVVEPAAERRIEAQFGGFTPASLMRSAVLPGWGQIYDRANTKGTVFMIAAAGAGGFFYFAHNGYANKTDEYNVLQESYVNSVTRQERDRIMQEMHDHYKKLDDAYSMRKIALYTAAGLYVINLLDTILSHSRGSEIKLYSGRYSEIKMQPLFSFSSFEISTGIQITF